MRKEGFRAIGSLENFARDILHIPLNMKFLWTKLASTLNNILIYYDNIWYDVGSPVRQRLSASSWISKHFVGQTWNILPHKAGIFSNKLQVHLESKSRAIA